MKNTVYVVQIVADGIPRSPIIFKNEYDAHTLYITMVEDLFGGLEYPTLEFARSVVDDNDTSETLIYYFEENVE